MTTTNADTVTLPRWHAVDIDGQPIDDVTFATHNEAIDAQFRGIYAAREGFIEMVPVPSDDDYAAPEPLSTDMLDDLSR